VLQESYLKVWRHASSYDPFDRLADDLDGHHRQARRHRRVAQNGRSKRSPATDDALSQSHRTIPDPVEEMHLARLRPRRWRPLHGCPKTSAG